MRRQSQFFELNGAEFGWENTRNQICFGIIRVFGVPDDANDRIKIIQRNRQPFKDVRARFRFAKFKLRASKHHYMAVIHVVSNNFLEIQRFGSSMDEGHNVHPKSLLK